MTSKNKEECMADEVLTFAGTSALSDEEVVERVLAGDTALYEVVMRRYNTRLYRVVTFELVAQPSMGPVIVGVTGPAGTKDFLKTVLCKPDASI
jgi:hypothetical protein